MVNVLLFSDVSLPLYTQDKSLFLCLIHDRDSLSNITFFWFILHRNFLQSKWGMEEFLQAEHEFLQFGGRKKSSSIILILKEKMQMEGLRKEVKRFLTTRTYIDGTSHLDQVPSRLR